MTNTAKKNKRRLKKTVRKTMGALFLVSALVVAAIPVDNLRANDPLGARPAKVAVDINNCRIPIVDEDETIYTTGDGRFQFAYVSTNDAAASNKVAVILGYDGGRLEGGVLTIPDTVDAYLKYSENLGTTYGYCAVGKNGNFLFYEIITEKKDEFGNVVMTDDLTRPILDSDNNPVLDPISLQPTYEKIPVLEKRYKPCYYNDYAKWKDLEVEQFFYYTGVGSPSADAGEAEFEKTTESSRQRIQSAAVTYIGNQTLTAGRGEDAGTWTITKAINGGLVDTPEEGIFRGEKAGNISTLYVGPSLSGIGDYAFHGCTNLSSITLENGLDTIGNYAFANCVNLEGVNVDITAMITTIGSHAFYNCRALRGFTTPRQVSEIGDSAFEGCTKLEEVELCGMGKNVQLSKLGHDVFKNCTKLRAVVLPDSYEESDLDISMWEGCTSLTHITAQNGKVNFVESASNAFQFEQFKETVPATFYFEGMRNSALYDTATNKSMAFKYLDEDIYEITIETDGEQAVYQVNSANELIKCEVSSGISEVEIPMTIGPYQITCIWSASFQGSCTLKKITIPSSITTIEQNAFRGCHNLETVIFAEPVNIVNIGANAFQTQDVTEHRNCPDETLSQDPVLQFVGPISYSCVPFTYAMDPGSNINVGSQRRSYITYYSSWPQNLQVKYNPDTDKNELVNYPTFTELQEFNSIVSEAQALSKYPYMTKKNWNDYVTAAKEAVAKYGDPVTVNTMTDYEKEIVDAALNIVLPEGIESVKQGLFTEKELDPSESGIEKTIAAYSLIEIPAESFKNCSNLTKIDLIGGTETIGDHAFENCTKLEEVYLPDTLKNMGLRPFANCGKLEYVTFLNNPYFLCDKSIIFERDVAGNKSGIIEYLEGRASGVITADELTGVSRIAEEAFMDTEVSSVDLRETNIEDIAADSFAETDKLFAVYLPNSWRTITDGAFRDSTMQYLEIPGNLGYIGNDAFTNHEAALTFYCEDGSSAKLYAEKNGIKSTQKPTEVFCTIRFWDYDNTLLDTQTLLAGGDAIPPTVPERVGYIHIGWAPDYHGISRDMDVTAQYVAEDPDARKVTVNFLDYDDRVIKTILVVPGTDAEAPADPVREGYTFTGWRPAITNITENTTIYAQYEKKDSSQSQFTVRYIDYDDKVLYVQKLNPGESGISPQVPGRQGYKFIGWRPTVAEVKADTDVYAQYEKLMPGEVDNSGSGGGTGALTTKVYNLTVRNGSGSGSYAAGTQPIVIANDPASGKEFSHWSISPDNTKIASLVLTATVITMPEGDVTVTANYKNKTGGSSGTGSSNSSVNNRPNNSGKISSGTTVVIDKNGLSNTGVVSATVNGSSDNFTIKVSDSNSASEAAVMALKAAFGDLTGIKYVPMDISLYDATGKHRVTDTKGLSISITLPLPDSLVPYAGNNKVASVNDNTLEKLSTKFTTISGVPCVTFTAEHFSPYVIYVDTNNLTASMAKDNTPKTGDGIHPKWFLSIGLASIAVVLFLKKDRRRLKTVRA